VTGRRFYRDRGGWSESSGKTPQQLGRPRGPSQSPGPSCAWRPAIGGGERRVMRAASGQKRPLPSNLGSMQGRAARSADADSVLNLYHGVI
jgi:hypothetical protein